MSLRTLVQVQGDFEASVKNMLQGLDDLWAQLEELHTGVTLFKQETQGHRDLASAQRDTQVKTCGNQLANCSIVYFFYFHFEVFILTAVVNIAVSLAFECCS